MDSPFCIYSTGHLHSAVVSEAISKGTGFPIVGPAPLVDGGVVMYGFLRGLLPTLKQAQQEGRAWVYADRGYLKATHGNDHSGFFRLTRGGYQFSGLDEDRRRFKALGLEIKPWRKTGKHILVCPPGDVFSQAVGGFAAEDWQRTVLGALYASTDRPVRIRMKSEAGRRPLAADLIDCHALVTYMSNTAVEALLAGVPVFCARSSAAMVMACDDLAQIENPSMPEGREEWAAALANNQWTLDELRKGAAARIFA